MYEIQCYDLLEMIMVCQQLTKGGLCFKADSHTLKVTLTGGY